MASDLRPHSFLLKISPSFFHPYILLMRLDRPAGLYLLLLPALLGLTWGSSFAPSFFHIILFSLGSFLMRSAGCVINDLWDQPFDAQVTRTKERPLAKGTLSQQHAFFTLGILLFLSASLLFFLPSFCLYLSLLSLVLIGLYPLMKRITYFPQAFLGITFNMGALMGIAAEKKTLSFSGFFLYGALFFWTLHYDTIYAHQDKEDDLFIGVKSTALFFKETTPSFLILCSLLTCLFLSIAGRLEDLSFPYFIGIFFGGLLMAKESLLTHLDNPRECLKSFKRAPLFAILILTGLLLSKLY